ncbi:EH signature domain-containing protein [Comamonas sp. B21-038]|uniref:EH signature domain-containing protein n=1 Tax=Comamonas sp. B21-038 TaxID=2918299 RepID=UPI001EFBCE64|nr:EH signature domain-containing protein [Comamonas sp. B21-038]ULR90342.1 EH signature domain-containing protein [Comamonas sp. B21-038]
MSPLEHLASLLRVGTDEGSRELAVSSAIDAVLVQIRDSAKGSARQPPSEEQQLDAVRRFWQSQEVASFRDAYLLSGGLCLPHKQDGPCVLEDRHRLEAVLDGVDSWTSKRPSAFRRCYWGLAKSYFTYDVFDGKAPATARNNWKLLRDYLHDKNGDIKDKQINPDWVATAIGNRQLFGEDPCAPYISQLLQGDTSAIDHLCKELGIDKASWFLRELVLGQIRGATQLSDSQFKGLLPRMLELLANNDVLRDRGLVMLLDRYVKISGMHLQQNLRDWSVLWWGNPWLPSNETRWGGVVPEARSMVSDWLKLEFIETFFTKLAEDGLGDRRRLEFWTRYVKAIDHIEFALGSTARSAQNQDFVALRKKMNGLICNLEASTSNNAFIMRMGNLVAVEFSDMGALYGYDARMSVPFDTSKPLRLDRYYSNSLKQKDRSILWFPHRDGINGWARWEHMFEAKLHEEFGIQPLAGMTPVTRPVAVPPPVRPGGTPTRGQPGGSGAAVDFPQHYNRFALNKLAHRLGLRIEDRTPKGGSLWVLADNSNQQVSETLSSWGFQYKAGKGWWK